MRLGSDSRVIRALGWLPTLALVLPWIVGPAAPATHERVRSAVGTAAFSLLDWETRNLLPRAPRLLAGLLAPADASAAGSSMLKSPDGSPAEDEVEAAVAEAYRANGVAAIGSPLGNQLFPPVLAAFSEPPSVLLVSPRSRLAIQQSVLLRDKLPQIEQERLESSVDTLGVASLVMPIGGLATYPSTIRPGTAPRTLVNSVAHEWVHHHLFFYPLGAAYWASQEGREINETVADMLAEEVTPAATARLGGADRSPQVDATTAPDPPRLDPAFRLLRQTRDEVEDLLAKGKIGDAEALMARRRVDIAAAGLLIRKLNQAYLAFYGSYSDAPSGSSRSPTPALLRELRSRGSMGEFLARVRAIQDVAELRQLLDVTPPLDGRKAR